jgi:hypothetical protein
MALPIRTRTAWILVALVSLIPAGCGAGNTATVTGKVTYDGQPVESGFITFFPDDQRGSTAEGEIINGEYAVSNLTPGKKRVFISITEQVEPLTSNVTKSREEANAQRLAKRKPPSSKQAVPSNFSGNNKIVEIGSGNQQLDFPLGKPRTGK